MEDCLQLGKKNDQCPDSIMHGYEDAALVELL